MRIVFISTSLSTGGAEMMLLKLLERLDRTRVEPAVISMTDLGEIGPRIAALGIPLQVLGMRAGAIPKPSHFFRLLRVIRAWRPDVVHTWMYHADLLGGLAARLAGVSSIGWCIRNSNLDKDKTKWSTRTVVRLCAVLSRWVPARILSCSERARQVHVALGYAAEKMVVVPNGFDLARFKPDTEARRRLRSELGLSDRTPLVGLIGRFDPQKNHVGFLAAAGMLHRRLPNAHFVLAGRGVDAGNETLQQAIHQAGVQANTHLLGLRNDISDVMAALDVLASSSSYGEAFPSVLGEAMACGVPCAVTDVGDSAFIIGDTGRVVPPGDMAGLAEAIEALLSLSAADRHALGAAARARVAANFEIEAVVRRYEDFYDQLLA